MDLSDEGLRGRLEDMAGRGQFVRDDFGHADPLASAEIIALVAEARREQAERDAKLAEKMIGATRREIAAAIRAAWTL